MIRTNQRTMLSDSRTEVVLGHIQDATSEACIKAKQAILKFDPNALDIIEMLGLHEIPL